MTITGELNLNLTALEALDPAGIARQWKPGLCGKLLINKKSLFRDGMLVPQSFSSKKMLAMGESQL